MLRPTSVFLWLLAVATFLGGSASHGVSSYSFVQPTAALLVLGVTFGLCLISFPFSVLKAAFTVLWSRPEKASAESRDYYC